MANLIQSAKAQVSQLTAQAYEAAVAAGVLPAGVELKGSVEIPKDPQNGDYASSVAMAGAKAMSTVHLHRGLHKRGWPLPHVCLHDCGQRPP